MWILGLLFIITLTFVGYYTVVRILWELNEEGKRGMREIEESKRRRQQQADWNAYLDRRFPKE